MEKTSWTDSLRNERVLQRVKEESIIPHTIKMREVSCVGHCVRRNCILKHVFEGKLKER
jgi:predicted metal-binding protein